MSVCGFKLKHRNGHGCTWVRLSNVWDKYLPQNSKFFKNINLRSLCQEPLCNKGHIWGLYCFLKLIYQKNKYLSKSFFLQSHPRWQTLKFNWNSAFLVGKPKNTPTKLLSFTTRNCKIILSKDLLSKDLNQHEQLKQTP